ncbi:sodium:proton antiporter [Porticoccaceae bacterium]|jgi:Na+/H+ antiporter NhaC|nr:sodium:proton antiporter [Porticoccaceae bacterium]CAI8283991.1 MAG: Malate-2H(+)/Na(+)-lactate antiporter [SAR92 bacterium MED-G29]MDB4109401.1 sodium:proton antiporter [Porticoccaceae bacterium]MDB9843234.1 sodium:proton antiporter [Porticoccaceae bacterium]MDC0134324.1 sodium:proton antiporter [Porticoccaceae bacterium]|tara:strand:- start:3034 stop:4380 length:1347 start_codon:yes stop_codon:yes gene_type:complete
MESFGAISLIPTVVVISIAVLTHRPILALLSGVIAGLLLINPATVIGGVADLSLEIMMDETIGWVIMVCGLMGSLIMLLIKTGAASAFANTLAAKANTRDKSLLVTWLLGMVIFIDDYLNAIAIGSSMKKVTDRYKVSRSMLSYVVDSTAAPTCVIVPISTWAVYFAALLEDTGTAAAGEGMRMYISGIPYMFYAWIAIMLVPLVATGRLPLIGPMKRAEAMAQKGTLALEQVTEFDEGADPSDTGATLWTFLLPLLSLIGFSWYFDIDLLKGVMVTLAITVPMMVLQNLLPFKAALDAVMDGFKIMLPPLAVVVTAFMFKAVNDQLGLPQYVIDSVTPLMSPLMLPLVTFITMALVAFATGSSWGVFAIAIPIVMPLAVAMDVPMPLMIGALLSASSFGSHACFYSDSTVLVAQSTGSGVMEHALSQLPYALIAASLAGLLFVLVGL